jgi:hypothetical protein
MTLAKSVDGLSRSKVAGQRVIATISLVGDGHLGLPMEEIYGEQVCRLRHWWLVSLMRLMAQFSWRHGLDHLLLAVHPRHARFYRRCRVSSRWENRSRTRACAIAPRCRCTWI